MTFDEFKIGTEFFTMAGKWRVTDVGTRIVAAIRTTQDWEAIAEGWLKGPPYTVAEHVFDENDLDGCYLTKKDMLRQL